MLTRIGDWLAENYTIPGPFIVIVPPDQGGKEMSDPLPRFWLGFPWVNRPTVPVYIVTPIASFWMGFYQILGRMASPPIFGVTNSPTPKKAGIPGERLDLG